VTVRVLAVACYLVALLGAAAFAGKTILLGIGHDSPVVALPLPAWLVNLLWLALFALQHTGMARRSFKRLWAPIVSPRLERSVYALASGAILLGMAATWQPLSGGTLWSGPNWLSVVALAGGLGAAAINLAYDHPGLFGLRQAWQTAEPPEVLLITGPYRFVRHPMMACLLVFLWGHANMTPTLLLWSGGFTAYILVGLVFEERDLARTFGSAYSGYRRRVPMLVPWRPPAPPETHPAVPGR